MKVFVRHLSISALLLSGSMAGAAGLQVLSIQNGYRVRYTEADGPGIMTLYQSASPLFATQTQVASATFDSTNWSMDIPSSALPLDQAFLRAHVLRGENPEDESDVDETIPSVILLAQGFPMSASGTRTAAVSFALVNPSGDSIPFTGDVRLGANGIIPVGFVPEILHFVDGFAQAQLTFTVAAPTELDLIAAATRVGANSQLAGQIIYSYQIDSPTPLTRSTLAAAVASTAVTVDDGNWHHPLGSNAGLRVTGSFGEHRANRSYIHEGYDLSPPPSSLATTVVSAARAGRVIWTSDLPLNKGKKVVIDHGDGWYSAYFHLSSPLSVAKGQAVSRGAPLAGGLNRAAAHLHFEVRHGTTTGLGVNYKPGDPINQIEVPSMFSLPSSPNGLTIKAFGITSRHPAEIPVVPGYFEPAERSGPVYVYLRAAHRFIDPVTTEERNLAPYGIQFIPDSNAVKPPIITSSKLALAPFAVTSRNDPDRGFARYAPDQIDPNSTEHYALGKFYLPYWFRWTPATYTGASGPQTFRILMVDYYGRQGSTSFTFGPQLRVRADSNYIDRVLGHLQRYRVAMDYYLGREGLVQPDRYQVNLRGAGKWEHTSDGAFESELMSSPFGSGTTTYYLLRPVLDRTPFALSAESLAAPGVKDEGIVTPSALGDTTVVRVVEIEVNGSIRASNIGGIASYQSLGVGDSVKLTGYLIWRRATAATGEPTSGPIPDQQITSTWEYTGINPLPTKQLAPSQTRIDGAFEVFFTVGDSDFKENSSSVSWNIRSRFAGGTANNFQGAGDAFFCAAHR